MNLPEIASFSITLFFGIIAIYLIYQSEKEKKEALLANQQTEKQLKKFQILHDIEQKIDHSHSVEDLLSLVVDQISLLYPHTTASYLLVNDQKAILKTRLFDSTNKAFLLDVKRHMLASFATLSRAKIPEKISEELSGMPLDDQNLSTVASFYAVSLVENDKIIGLLALASDEENLYKEDEMQSLHDIIDHSSLALSKLNQIAHPLHNIYMPLFENLAHPVFVFDTSFNLSLSNLAARKLFLSTDFKDAEDVAKLFKEPVILLLKLKDCQTNNRPIQVKDMQIGHKNIKIFLTPIHNNKGEIWGVSMLLIDQTEEKTSAKLKDDFQAMVVHELRAPLASIRSAAELLLAQDGKLSDDDQKKLLSLIESQSKRLLDDVSSILDSAKLEQKKFSIEKSPVDLKVLLSKSFEEFIPQAKEKQIELRFDIPQNLPKVEMDPLRIEQVITNLLSNSLKFTPRHGQVNLTVQLTDGAIKIIISDTGVGIPKEKQADLFSKFFQVTHPNFPTDSAYLMEKAKTEKLPSAVSSSYHTGTGLGLFIVKGIVQAHGGMVGLESEPDKGTKVWFTLPLQSKTQRTEEPTAPRPFVFTKAASKMVN